VGALMFARTLSLSGVVSAQALDSIWFLVYQPVGFLIFLVSGIAENNRAPFDLPEAESELVAGFHTEYSGMRWSLFFMAEYAAMVVVSAIAVTVYLGGWYFPFVYRLTEANGHHNLYVIVSLIVFIVKLLAVLYLYFWLRWTLPRFRYDQLMDIGWKWLIPSALINIGLSALAIFLVQALDGWRGFKTIEGLAYGLNLTPAGKGIMIFMGLLGLVITGLLLSRINWRSRDFNLRVQRRNIRLVNLPKGKPAVPVSEAAVNLELCTLLAYRPRHRQTQEPLEKQEQRKKNKVKRAAAVRKH
jgi:NADH-quinone oxidoreductase subunit H